MCRVKHIHFFFKILLVLFCVYFTFFSLFFRERDKLFSRKRRKKTEEKKKKVVFSTCVVCLIFFVLLSLSPPAWRSLLCYLLTIIPSLSLDVCSNLQLWKGGGKTVGNRGKNSQECVCVFCEGGKMTFFFISPIRGHLPPPP